MDLTKLATAAKAWNDNEDKEIAQAIKDSEAKFVQLNKDQMLKSKDSKDKSLAHQSTGKTKLTSAYAKKTGKTKPNLLLENKFQPSIFLKVKTKEFLFDATDFKTPFLTKNYGIDIFGIAPSNDEKATKEASNNYLNNYVEKVWKS